MPLNSAYNSILYAQPHSTHGSDASRVLNYALQHMQFSFELTCYVMSCPVLSWRLLDVSVSALELAPMYSCMSRLVEMSDYVCMDIFILSASIEYVSMQYILV